MRSQGAIMTTFSPSASLLKGAEIAGTLWRVLGLQLPKQRRETGRKFLSGKRPLDGDQRVGLLRAMVSEFVQAGYVGALRDPEADEIGKLLAAAATIAIGDWDRVVGRARAVSGPPNPEAVRFQYFRVATVDVAIRAAALDVFLDGPILPDKLAGCDQPGSPWTQPGGFRQQLRSLPAVLGVSWARIYGGSARQKTKDDWIYRDSRPLRETLEDLAERLAKHAPGTAPATWLRFLLWGFARDAMCSELAAALPGPAISELIAMFHEVRSVARTLLARCQRDDAVWIMLRRLIVLGAHAPDAGPLIDAIVRDRGLAIPSGDESRWSHQWLATLRTSRADWILCELSGWLPAYPALPDGVSPQLVLQIMHEVIRGDFPAADALCAQQPGALLWISRMVAQQAFLRGTPDTASSIAAMFARFAEVSQSPALHFEAGWSWLMAGNHAAALQHLEQGARTEPLATTMAPVIAALKALTGAHAEAIPLLVALPERDATTDHALGIALRGVGRIAEALHMFEHILSRWPWHAGALEQAALCCYDLGRTVEGNQHAKKAARLGRPVVRPRRRRTRDPGGAPPASA